MNTTRNELNLLLLNYEFPPMGGGAGNATWNIAKELVRQGHRVSVLTSRLKGQLREETASGVDIHRVFSWRKGIHDCGLRGAYSFIAAAWPVVRRLCKHQHYDVVHYFFTLPTGSLTFLPGRHNSIPHVVSLRGSDVPWYDEFNPLIHRLNLLLRPVIRRIWNGSGRVVALSRGLREIARRTDPKVRIDVIPNGIEANLFTPGTGPERTGDGPFRLITVSRLINRKGIDHLIEAVASLRESIDLRLQIVGLGNFMDQLREKVQTTGTGDIVEFHGYCPREELPELYRQADLFALPSLAESFGLVFAEAMACGLPILGGRTGGVPDLVHESNGILVTPGNVDEIRDAIRALHAQPDLRRAMSSNNRARVLENYAWDSVARRYAQIYREIADS